MATSNPWGNPAVQTFRKKFIRQVAVGEHRILVHSAVADIVAEILNSAVAAGAQLPDNLRGWVPVRRGTAEADLLPEHYGVMIDVIEGAEYEAWGFSVRSGGTAFFPGSIDDAKRLSDAAESARMVRAANAEPPQAKDVRWQSLRPGKRHLQLGDAGDDVMFLQCVFDCADKDGVFGLDAKNTVMWLQKRFGQEQTGLVDDVVWGIVLPTGKTCSPGDVGIHVRVLQALLVSYDWDYGVQITGRFDQATSLAIRHLQDTVGLRVTGRVRAPEWAYLLGSDQN